MKCDEFTLKGPWLRNVENWLGKIANHGRTFTRLSDGFFETKASFKHSGDYGDLVYGMPIMKYLNGGTLFLSRSRFTREEMTEKRIAMIAPLLLSQSYVHRVEPHYGQAIKYDLDWWRGRSSAEHDPLRTLAERNLIEFGIGKECLDRPWITGISPVKCARVVINRTARYRNPKFPWKKILEKYKGDTWFIGTEAEFKEFRKMYSTGTSLPWMPTDDLLEVARIIRGSDLFIGNQSCCYAIAEAMKHNTIQETDVRCPDCMFERKNAQYVIGDDFYLPDL
jgi:hypothetical protein